jgi:hypothetical protein
MVGETLKMMLSLTGTSAATINTYDAGEIR